MAAVIATLKGKVLLQFGDAEPVEVGRVEIPIHAGTRPQSTTRGVGIDAQALTDRAQRTSPAEAIEAALNQTRGG